MKNKNMNQPVVWHWSFNKIIRLKHSINFIYGKKESVD